MKPLGTRGAVVLAALVFAAVLAKIAAGGAWREDFRIDEAHKISESAFLGLWLGGDFRNAAWFANIIDRTNPPVGKYVFGAAIRLSGHALPLLPTLSRHEAHGALPPMFPEEQRTLRPLLPAVRFVSATAITLTAALLTLVLGRTHGWVSAVLAAVLFVSADVIDMYATWAVFDPLFGLLFAMLIVWVAAFAARRSPWIAAAIGMTAALAFQVRLNGLFALVLALPAVWLIARRMKPAAVTLVAFGATALALNPLYWSTPAMPVEPFASHRGPLRPLQRLLQQKHDIETVARPYQELRSEGRTAWEKTTFFAMRGLYFDRWSGAALTLSAIAGVVALARRRRTIPSALRAALLMALAVIVMMVATLPMPWDRYLVVVMAPLALVGGFGAAELLAGIAQKAKGPRLLEALS